MSWGANARSPGTTRGVGKVLGLRSYDARNRLVLVDYPDATPDVATTYTADGKVATISRAPTLLSYTYNKRGLLSSERLEWGSINYLTSHSYTTLGHLGATTYPSGHQVAYAPNALGQADLPPILRSRLI